MPKIENRFAKLIILSDLIHFCDQPSFLKKSMLVLIFQKWGAAFWLFSNLRFLHVTFVAIKLWKIWKLFWKPWNLGKIWYYHYIAKISVFRGEKLSVRCPGTSLSPCSVFSAFISSYSSERMSLGLCLLRIDSSHLY